MDISRKNLTSLLLLTIALVSSLTLYFYWNSGMNQVFLLVTLALLLGLVILNRAYSDKVFIIVLCINVASLLVTMAFHRSMGVTILFINVLLASFIFNNIHVEKHTYICIHAIPAIFWSVMCIAAVSGSFYYGETYLGETYWGYTCFGMLMNENAIALLSLSCMFHWLCIIEQLPFRRATRILIAVAVSAFPVWRMIQAGCRSVLLTAIIFVILYLALRKPIPYRTFYLIVLAVIICSAGFTIVYSMYIESLGLGDIMGRDSLSRVYIWEAAFDLIKKYPIFGSGTEIQMAMLDSAHNTVLSWMKTIGLIPTVTYAFFLARRRPDTEGTYSKVAQLVVIASLLISFFESFYADSMFCMSFMLFFLQPGESSKTIEEPVKSSPRGEGGLCHKVSAKLTGPCDL